MDLRSQSGLVGNMAISVVGGPYRVFRLPTPSTSVCAFHYSCSSQRRLVRLWQTSQQYGVRACRGCPPPTTGESGGRMQSIPRIGTLGLQRRRSLVLSQLLA